LVRLAETWCRRGPGNRRRGAIRLSKGQSTRTGIIDRRRLRGDDGVGRSLGLGGRDLGVQQGLLNLAVVDGLAVEGPRVEGT
jgi:hypothetical protein